MGSIELWQNILKVLQPCYWQFDIANSLQQFYADIDKACINDKTLFLHHSVYNFLERHYFVFMNSLVNVYIFSSPKAWAPFVTTTSGHPRDKTYKEMLLRCLLSTRVCVS